METLIIVVLPSCAAVLSAWAAWRVRSALIHRRLRALIMFAMPLLIAGGMFAVFCAVLLQAFDGTCGPAFMDLDALPRRRPCGYDDFAARQVAWAFVFSAPTFAAAALATVITSRWTKLRRRNGVVRR